MRLDARNSAIGEFALFMGYPPSYVGSFPFYIRECVCINDFEIPWKWGKNHTSFQLGLSFTLTMSSRCPIPNYCIEIRLQTEISVTSEKKGGQNPFNWPVATVWNWKEWIITIVWQQIFVIIRVTTFFLLFQIYFWFVSDSPLLARLFLWLTATFFKNRTLDTHNLISKNWWLTPPGSFLEPRTLRIYLYMPTNTQI